MVSWQELIQDSFLLTNKDSACTHRHTDTHTNRSWQWQGSTGWGLEMTLIRTYRCTVLPFQRSESRKSSQRELIKVYICWASHAKLSISPTLCVLVAALFPEVGQFPSVWDALLRSVLTANAVDRGGLVNKTHLQMAGVQLPKIISWLQFHPSLQLGYILVEDSGLLQVWSPWLYLPGHAVISESMVLKAPSRSQSSKTSCLGTSLKSHNRPQEPQPLKINPDYTGWLVTPCPCFLP